MSAPTQNYAPLARLRQYVYVIRDKYGRDYAKQHFLHIRSNSIATTQTSSVTHRIAPFYKTNQSKNFILILRFPSRQKQTSLCQQLFPCQSRPRKRFYNYEQHGVSKIVFFIDRSTRCGHAYIKCLRPDRRSFGQGKNFSVLSVTIPSYHRSFAAATPSLFSPALSKNAPHNIIHAENTTTYFPWFKHNNLIIEMNLIAWRFDTQAHL